jgi:hypothetical protein
MDDVVDVLMSDHPAPKVVERLRGRDMVRIEGGTQALRRTINARLQITLGKTTALSVPSPFGALILKAAAYTTDSRDRERHLFDAVETVILSGFMPGETVTGGYGTGQSGGSTGAERGRGPQAL